MPLIYTNSTNWLYIYMKDALLLLFQMSTNAQALLMTAIQMRFVLTQMVHSLVAATLDIPGKANNARVCFFFITIKLYYSRFKFVLFWYQWSFTAFFFFFLIIGLLFRFVRATLPSKTGHFLTLRFLWSRYPESLSSTVEHVYARPL